MITIGVGVVGLFIAVYLAFGGVIGAEFLPHLDEGSLWVRATLEQSAGPNEGVSVANRARIILCSFPETTECTSQTGRPDDGTDHTGFFNIEYFVGLKPKEQWRPVFHQNKDNLIASMTQELEKNIPGVVWGFSQPIEDNMEEAVSGVKGELATKVYGDDLHMLEDKANEIAGIMSHVRGIADLGVFNVTGQPDLSVRRRSREGRTLADQCGGRPGCGPDCGGRQLRSPRSFRGEEVYNLTLRYLPQYRETQARDRQHPIVISVGRESFAGSTVYGPGSRTRARKSIAKTTSVMSLLSTACAAARWGTRYERPSRR